MSKDSFVFYKSFADAINRLDDQEQLQAYKALVNYGCYGIEPQCNGMAGIIFDMAKPQIDANNRRYDNGKKGAKYGKLGGRPKKQKGDENPIGVIDKNPIGVSEEKPKKDAYGENGNVLLTAEEYQRLCAKYGDSTTKDAIDLLNNYIDSLEPAKKKAYLKKNHCRCMQNWVFDEVAKKQGSKKIEIDPKLRQFQAENEVVNWGI